MNINGLIISGIMLIFLMLNFPYTQGGEDRYKPDFLMINENYIPLVYFLKNTQYSGIYDINFLNYSIGKNSYNSLATENISPWNKMSKRIHNGKVFIAKTPLFPLSYMRLNVDFFTYLFLAPGITKYDLNKINKKMRFTEVGREIWLGEYYDLIMLRNAIAFVTYSAMIYWTFVFVCSTVFMIKSPPFCFRFQFKKR